MMNAYAQLLVQVGKQDDAAKVLRQAVADARNTARDATSQLRWALTVIVAIGVLTAFDADGNAIPNGGFFPRFFFTNLTDEDLEFNKEIFKQFKTFSAQDSRYDF